MSTARAQSSYATPYTVTTVAGSWVTGSTDGVGSAARFGSTEGLGIDGAGNLYVADSAFRTIRKITKQGVVTTLAGTPGGFPGSADGMGAAAQFSIPQGLAVDGAGNVYVADLNQTIRKITPDGTVTTFAGLANNGGDTDGTGGQARFGQPYALAVDHAGNIYVADQASVIRKITPDAVVTTLAGTSNYQGWLDGTGSAARFRQPSGIAVDGAGNVYVADEGSHTIRKITAAGVVTTLAGSDSSIGSTDGVGAAARFSHPKGLALDSAGNLFVAERENHTIRKITPDGTVTTVAGLAGVWGDGVPPAPPADGVGSAARFMNPQGLAADPEGNVYVSDRGNHRIRKCTPGLSAPVVTVQPVSQAAIIGRATSFTVLVDGYPRPTIQWRKDGIAISGATGTSLTIASTGVDDAGAYSAVATNSQGTVTSNSALLTVGSGASTDFNVDGQPDILWQNAATGERRLWLMNGIFKSSEVSFGSVGLDWQMAGTGDFNSDGHNDVVWQNTATGERSVWLMNGTGVAGQAAVVTVDPSWNIAVIADFNRDSRPDLLWENTLTGERGIWLMNGVNLAGYAELGIQGIQWNAAGAGDFNGDDMPDIIWQNSLTGERKVWLMNDTAKSSEVSLGFVALQWVIGAVADYNGDGSADVFWQDTATGEHAIWLMNGTTIAGYVFPANDSTDWVVGRIPPRPAASDFNRDGKPDLVWQNTVTGDRSVWLMNGAAFGSEIPLSNVPASWQIAGTGDLDNDGRCDVVWQNTVTGERGVWLMNGTNLAGYFSLGTVSLSWQIMGTGDFNADNRTDVLWQNTSTGERGVWLMNGTELSGYASLGAVALDWQIAGVGDFNRDDKPDIIWQNSVTGDRKVWLMNGTTFGSEVPLGNVALSWQIVGLADYNLDGQVDIIWQNSSTGESGIWLMNGTTLSGYVSLGSRSTNWKIAN